MTNIIEDKLKNPTIKSSRFHSWSYNKETGQIRINFTADALKYVIEDLQTIMSELKERPDLNIVTIVFVEDRAKRGIS